MTAPPSVNKQQVAGASSHARRRNRDASLDQAKQQFMATVDDAINNLMINCGYSRPRAVAALLHEFRREVPTPSEDEVFQAMQRYGLGIEEATRALIVSSALMRATKDNKISLVEAIDDLTKKLSLTNTRAMSEPSDFSDVDERPRSPDRRVETISSMERPSSVSRVQQISGSNRKNKAATKNGKAKSTKLAPAKSGTAPKPVSRKRLIEEANSDKKVILREIPDPVRDDVDAQVALKCKEDDSSLPDATTTATIRNSAQSVVPRAKRTHRAVEDAAASSQSSALKRARTSDA